MTDPLPQPWMKYQKEIDALLRESDIGYEFRTYITPGFYIHGIEPGKYPFLAQHPASLQKRYISYFLKERGRIPRGGSPLRAQIWMIPGAA
jgi:hypothetical protein